MSDDVWKVLFLIWMIYHFADIFYFEKRRMLVLKAKLVDGIIEDLKKSETTLVLTEYESKRLVKYPTKEIQ